MQMNYFVQYKKLMLLVVAFFYATVQTLAQPNTSVDLEKDKPKEYKERKLGSEKMASKKFTVPRRITQNTYTHFNYYFNANEKLKEVITNAKKNFKDNYTQLLPFYNYTLDATATSKNELDSIIYKCTAGVLLHDLRNDWVDNLYMLLGKAYLFRKDFDSAAGCFQYINFTYAPKEKGGYNILLGSNDSKTNGVFTISTKESKNLIKNLLTRQPSRNESFVWQTRNLLEQDLLGEAAGLIGILRSDPNFPKRLKTDLHEMIAYWFYKQQNYDSAAAHLKLSLDNAEDKSEKARWEYLAGQLYQLAHKDSLAINMFEKSIKHTTDPLMEIYARLNIVSLSSGKKKDALQDNLNELLKLAKKDRYESYRDIIYYAAAQLELQRNNYDAAQTLLLKSVKYSFDNDEQKNLSFLALADLNYERKKFIESSAFYDSAKIESIKSLSEKDKDRVAKRKPTLKIIAENYEVINREDSLQKIASMPDSLRNIYVKKISKALRKARGIKSSEDEGSTNTVYNTKQADLFGSNDSKGEWYFSNATLKSRGFSEFKAKWGKRTNTDNWRRQSAATEKTNTTRKPMIGGATDVDDVGADVSAKKDDSKDSNKADDKKDSEEDISFEGLMSKLPLTKEAIEKSNKKLQDAFFDNGEKFQNTLEEFDFAVDNYEELLTRFNEFKTKETALFNLYYCYKKLGLNDKADSIMSVLRNSFPDGDKTKILDKKTETKKEDAKNTEATKKYEHIYQLFLEGKFEEAKKEKINADATYGKSYWTPQLLYIEAIYYVKQREDSTALDKLNTLITTHATSPMAAKAKNMIDVIKNRKQIEEYLTKLEIERNDDEPEKKVDLEKPEVTTKKTETKKTDDVKTKDTIKTIDKKVEVKAIETNKKSFAFNAADSQYVMVVFNKIDKVFFNEAKGAFAQFNAQTFYNKKITITPSSIDDDNSILLLGLFENAGKAMEYVDKTKPQAPTKILSWIPADKYTFTIISNSNLSILKENKDLKQYIEMMKQLLPGKL